MIDANLNRSREALRIIEDISRFLLDNKAITKKVKTLRHDLQKITKSSLKINQLIESRNIAYDIGKSSNLSELKRNNVKDIFFANIQRAKESTRVLEEFLKLTNKNKALKFKTIRYKIYQIEKELFNNLK